MFKDNGLLKVLLFLACLYLAELAKRAGYIGIGIQVVVIIILMVLFLFGKKLLNRLKK